MFLFRGWRFFCATAVLVLAVCACDPPGVARAAKPVIDEPPPEAPYPHDQLAVVDVSESGCQLASLDEAGGDWTPDFDLRGDPDFDPDVLPPNVRCWYETLWTVLTEPSRADYFTWRAGRADLYTYAREINNHLVALLTAFRVTGDLALLDEVSRLTQHMRAQLDDRWTHSAARDDRSEDGYLNWVWDQNWSNEQRGRDIHETDDLRVSSVLAQVAYTFSQNAELDSPNGVDYAERASFWLDYLRNHFEAKWRERNDAPWPKMPFIVRPHLHETLEFVRYHHYMHLLTGEEAYAEEAAKLSRVAYENFREVETDAGVALVTPRSILSMGGAEKYLLPSVYYRHVLATAVDLHFAGVEPWSEDETMEMLTRSLSEFILDGEGDGFGRDVGGGIERAGIPPSGESNWSRIAPSVYNISAFALMSAWDDSGEVAKTSIAVHVNRGRGEWSVYVPTGMLLDAALNGEVVAAEAD